MTYSELNCRRLYIVHEMVQFARQLFMMVVQDECLPSRYDLSAWRRLGLPDLRLDPGKRAALRAHFSEHVGEYEDAGEFEEALGRVEEAVLSIALNCLDLGGVADPVCVAVSSLCPMQLLYGDEGVQCEEAQYLLDILLAAGHVRLSEQSSFVDSYQRFYREFREVYRSGDVLDPSIVVRTLFELASGDEVMQRFLKLSLCLCGTGTLRGTVMEVSSDSLTRDQAESVCRMLYSWCVCYGVRSAASLPRGLVADVQESLVEVPEGCRNAFDLMWSRVGRVGDAEYRAATRARLGF